MQGLCRSDGGIGLELSPANSLTFDIAESTEDRIRRIVSETPVVVLSKPSCCLGLVMKSLLSSVGAQLTVVELGEDDDILAQFSSSKNTVIHGSAPTVFVGGVWLGGLENLIALHLSGHLVPKLVQADALEAKVV